MEFESKNKEYQELSAFKIERLFRYALEIENSYPLSPDNLIIDPDHYGDLGEEIEDDDDYIYPFATLDCSTEEDCGLNFTLKLFPFAVLISLEFAGTFAFRYDEIDENEERVVERIMSFLRLVCSGQIACLLTKREGRICAVELVLKDDSYTKSPSLIMHASYSWLWTDSETNTEYITELKQNAYIQQVNPLPLQMLFFERDQKGVYCQVNRWVAGLPYPPLTKRSYSLITTDKLFQGSGKKINEEEFSFFYGSWEFWLGITVFILIIEGLIEKGILPSFLHSVPQLTWPISLFLIYRFLIPLLRWKEELKVYAPAHPYVRVDAFFKVIGLGILSTIAYLGIFALSFAPLYLLPQTSKFITLMALSDNHQWIKGIIVSFLIAAILSLGTSKLTRVAAAVVGISGIAGNIYANFTLTNLDVESPEPYTTLIFVLIIVAPILSLWRLKGVSGETETIDSLILKATSKYKIACLVERIAWHGAALLLLFAAWQFYKGLTVNDLRLGNPALVSLYLVIVAMLGMTGYYAYKFKVISSTWLSVVGIISFFAYVCVPAFFLKEGSEGPGIAYIAQFLGAFGLILSSAAREMIQAKLENAKARRDSGIGLENTLLDKEIYIDPQYNSYYICNLDDYRGKSKKAQVKFQELLTELSKVKCMRLLQPDQHQFEAILARINVEKLSVYGTRASDLTALESQIYLEELELEWNTKAETLWNLSCNSSLQKLTILDFSKIYDISLLANAKKLEVLILGGGIWNKLRIKTLVPISKLPHLKELDLSNITVEKEGLCPLATLPTLEKLEVSNQFAREDYAFLSVAMPHVECKYFKAYVSIEIQGSESDVMVIGKRMPLLNSKKDAVRLENFTRQFKVLQDKYRKEIGENKF